jgi:hypothetical protein
MLAAERGFKQVDAMNLPVIVTNLCDFYITNLLGFKSTCWLDVVYPAEFIKKFLKRFALRA